MWERLKSHRFAIVVALRKVTYADHRSGTGGFQVSLELDAAGRSKSFSLALWTWKVERPTGLSTRAFFEEADARRIARQEEGAVLLRQELLAEEDE